jgi:uncharacterized protein YciI
MRHPYRAAIVAGLVSMAVAAAATRAFAEAPTGPPPAALQAAAPAEQFLYVLRLTPRLHDDAAWTDADKAAVSRHFEHLQRATAARKVVLAGRTREPGEKTFGLVIFEAADEDDARGFMASDPAVVAGIMTATLHPYAIAMQRDR